MTFIFEILRPRFFCNFRVPFAESQQFVFERDGDVMPLIESTLGFDSKSSATFEKLPMKAKEYLGLQNPSFRPRFLSSSRKHQYVLRKTPTANERNSFEQELGFQAKNIPSSKRRYHLVKATHPWIHHTMGIYKK